MQPVILPANQPAGRFYAGGPAITAFRGADGGDTAAVHGPEDWVASTTAIRGQETLGLSELPDGTLLADRITAAPLDWLGPEHVASYGPDTKLLVKLLDAGQRLPVHAHPHASFAAEQLGAAHGKAEAWYILSPGEVFLGLRHELSTGELAELVDSQDAGRMLGLMHRVAVRAGQTVYVPPGLLHAIGQGILLVEVQEPEDLSILAEWRGFEIDGRTDGHLGLGYEIALGAVESRARTAAEILALVGTEENATSLLPAEAAEFFRLDRLRVPGASAVEAGFGVLVVIAGSIDLIPAHAGPMPLAAGTTTVIPYRAGELAFAGDGTALLARPPAS